MMYIEEITIKNFKSLKDVKFTFNKINVFIGDTNTGKSNVIEALAFLGSFANFDENHYGEYLRKFIRFHSFVDLFYDRNFENSIEFSLTYDDNGEKKEFQCTISGDENGLTISDPNQDRTFAEIGYDGQLIAMDFKALQDLKSIKFYNFARTSEAEDISSNVKDRSLRPPNGNNLFQTIWYSKSNRDFVAELFSFFGYRVVFEIAERNILFQKQEEDYIVHFPFVLLSDTLRLSLYYYMALLSNQSAILCFDEPEVFMFPSHVINIGEDIVGNWPNKHNQIILTTHNPYFLESIVAKSDFNDLNIYIPRLKDLRSDFKLLDKEQVQSIYQNDLLMNYEAFFGE